MPRTATWSIQNFIGILNEYEGEYRDSEGDGRRELEATIAEDIEVEAQERELPVVPRPELLRVRMSQLLLSSN